METVTKNYLHVKSVDFREFVATLQGNCKSYKCTVKFNVSRAVLNCYREITLVDSLHVKTKHVT